MILIIQTNMEIIVYPKIGIRVYEDDENDDEYEEDEMENY